MPAAAVLAHSLIPNPALVLRVHQVVAMAGRCAERLVLGEANVSTAGAADLEGANHIAREMVFRCGFRLVVLLQPRLPGVCPCRVRSHSLQRCRRAPSNSAPVLHQLLCSKRLGPVSLMDNEETYLGNQG